MYIKENIRNIKSQLPRHVKLVAVSKTKPDSDILEAYYAGQLLFGENKVQELLPKYENLPKEIKWHFIGHLQTNKVKFIAPFIATIQSVDSLKLLSEINKEAAKNNRKINCLLEFHIATEESKFGLSLDEADEILNSPDFKEMNNISICGVMGMASFTDNLNKVREEFASLKKIYDSLKLKYFQHQSEFAEISMGMSGDYKIAIEEGATIVRIGSILFGERIY